MREFLIKLRINFPELPIKQIEEKLNKNNALSKKLNEMKKKS